jgi:hypothetical protein
MKKRILSAFVLSFLSVLPLSVAGPAQSMTQETSQFLEGNSLCKTAVEQIINLKYDWRNGADLHIVRVGLSPDDLLSVLHKAGVDEVGVQKIEKAFEQIVRNANGNPILMRTVETVFSKSGSHDDVGLTCDLLKDSNESIQFPLNYVITPLENSTDFDIKKALPLDPIPHPNGGMSRIEPILLDRVNPHDPENLRAWLMKFFKDSSDFTSNRLLSEWIAKNNLITRADQSQIIDPLFSKYVKIVGHVIFIDPKFYYTFMISRKYDVILAVEEIFNKTSLPEGEKNKLRNEALEAITLKAGPEAIQEFHLNPTNVLEIGGSFGQQFFDFNNGIQATALLAPYSQVH